MKTRSQAEIQAVFDVMSDPTYNRVRIHIETGAIAKTPSNDDVGVPGYKQEDLAGGNDAELGRDSRRGEEGGAHD